jgi:hypothetical protein
VDCARAAKIQQLAFGWCLSRHKGGVALLPSNSEYRGAASRPQPSGNASPQPRRPGPTVARSSSACVVTRPYGDVLILQCVLEGGEITEAMYLSCDHWHRTARLANIKVAFHNAGPALFGVKEYVPPLMRDIERYGIDLRLESRLPAIDRWRRQGSDVSGQGGSRDSGGHKAFRHDPCPPASDRAGVLEIEWIDGPGRLDRGR